MSALDELKAALGKLRAEMEFHDDSEVHWQQLHHPPLDITRQGGACAVCGNSVYDDRWHFFYSVSTAEDRFEPAARAYEQLLHHQRRELHEKSKTMIHARLPGLDQK